MRTALAVTLAFASAALLAVGCSQSTAHPTPLGDCKVEGCNPDLGATGDKATSPRDGGRDGSRDGATTDGAVVTPPVDSGPGKDAIVDDAPAE